MKSTLDRFTYNACFGDKLRKLLARSLARHDYARSRVILRWLRSTRGWVAVPLPLLSRGLEELQVRVRVRVSSMRPPPDVRERGCCSRRSFDVEYSHARRPLRVAAPRRGPTLTASVASPPPHVAAVLQSVSSSSPHWVRAHSPIVPTYALVSAVCVLTGR